MLKSHETEDGLVLPCLAAIRYSVALLLKMALLPFGSARIQSPVLAGKHMSHDCGIIRMDFGLSWQVQATEGCKNTRKLVILLI